MRNLKTVGEFLKQARKTSGHTQWDAAKMLGHSTAQYISNLERGVCEASVEMAIELCDFYGANREDLFKLMLTIHTTALKIRFARARGAA